MTDAEGKRVVMTEEVGTGKYAVKDFECDDLDTLEAKMLELLQTTPAGCLVPIEDLAHTYDILWNTFSV